MGALESVPWVRPPGCTCGAFEICAICSPPYKPPEAERYLTPLDDLEGAVSEVQAKSNALWDQLTKNVRYAPAGVRRMAAVRAELTQVIARLEAIEARHGRDGGCFLAPRPPTPTVHPAAPEEK